MIVDFFFSVHIRFKFQSVSPCPDAILRKKLKRWPDDCGLLSLWRQQVSFFAAQSFSLPQPRHRYRWIWRGKLSIRTWRERQNKVEQARGLWLFLQGVWSVFINRWYHLPLDSLHWILWIYILQCLESGEIHHQGAISLFPASPSVPRLRQARMPKDSSLPSQFRMSLSYPGWVSIIKTMINLFNGHVSLVDRRKTRVSTSEYLDKRSKSWLPFLAPPWAVLTSQDLHWVVKQLRKEVQANHVRPLFCLRLQIQKSFPLHQR